VLTGDAELHVPGREAAAPAGARATGAPRAAGALGRLAPLLPAAAASFLVFYRLGWRSLWLDEGDTFTTASQHGAGLWHWALNDGGNMFAYYLGMHAVLETIGSSELALRLPSALAAIGTVLVSYYLVQRLFDARAAFFASSFVAVSLSFVFWSQQARAYSVGTFLTTASTLAFVVAVQERRRGAYIWWAVLSVLAVYTILLSALVLVAQVCSLVLRRRCEITWRALSVAAAAAGLLCLPIAVEAIGRGDAPVRWLAAPGSVFGSNARYFAQFLASANATPVTVNGVVAKLVLLGMALAWAGALCAAVYELVRHGLGGKAWSYGLLLGCLVVPVAVAWIVSVLVQPVITDRYILEAVPPASMLGGVAISRLRPLPVALALGGGLLALRAAALVPSYTVMIENWRSPVDKVLAATQPRDCIAFFVADGYTTFDYYVLHDAGGEVKAPTPVLPASSWASRTPHVLEPDAIARAKLQSVVAGCPRLWLLTSHDAGDPPGPGVLAYRVQTYEADKTLMSEIAANYTAESSSTWSDGLVVLYDRRGAAARSSG
jgi:mannosyltransferase